MELSELTVNTLVVTNVFRSAGQAFHMLASWLLLTTLIWLTGLV